VLRSLILGVVLLAACTPADPPMMIDGSRAASAEKEVPDKDRAAEQDASAR
jgi:hypothetical protein